VEAIFSRYADETATINSDDNKSDESLSLFVFHIEFHGEKSMDYDGECDSRPRLKTTQRLESARLESLRRHKKALCLIPF
jgi:hypothetical protein